MIHDSDTLKKKVAKLADKHGAKVVTYRLIEEGLSYSLAYQIISGSYHSDLKERTSSAITKVLERMK